MPSAKEEESNLQASASEQEWRLMPNMGLPLKWLGSSISAQPVTWLNDLRTT